MPNHTPISDGELAVMRLLWREGAISSRNIMERIYPGCSPSDHATVHSLLKRLEKKKLVTRDRTSHPHVFSATISQSEFAGRQFTDLAEKVTDGSLAPFLSLLIESNSLSKSQLNELRMMLDNHEPTQPAKKKRNSRQRKK
ncbi:MAG: BlaI/MecI/CopY family transcriptional regulator [Mariniblastus sp.]